jgi:hypothetical protein
MEFSVGEDSHRCHSPTEFVAYVEFVQKLLSLRIGFADEVVETLNRETTQIKMRGHTAWLRRGFEDLYRMARLDCVICG